MERCWPNLGWPFYILYILHKLRNWEYDPSMLSVVVVYFYWRNRMCQRIIEWPYQQHIYISFVVNREVNVVLPDTVLLTRSIIHNMLATDRSLLMLCLACYHLHLYICFSTCRTDVAKDCYIFHSCIWRREQVICDILSWVRKNLIKDWVVLFIDFDEKCLLTFYNIGNINVNKTSTIIELKVILKIWI